MAVGRPGHPDRPPLHRPHVVIDGRLELIRWPDGTATLRFQGIGNDIIDHDPNTCSNNMSDGIRSLAIYGKE